MSGSARRGPPDPRRKARFREIARSIVAKDRSDRKYGFTVDTAGAIAQALERAYRDGVRDGPAAPVAAPEQSDTGAVEWALIPPRPRDAFWSICLSILGGDASQSRDGHLAPAVTERGTTGWATVTAGHAPDRVIADRSVVPLVRLELLEQSSNPPERLFLTRLCQRYRTRFRLRASRTSRLGCHSALSRNRPQSVFAGGPRQCRAIGACWRYRTRAARKFLRSVSASEGRADTRGGSTRLRQGVRRRI
jgi:hypothetical protein